MSADGVKSGSPGGRRADLAAVWRAWAGEAACGAAETCRRTAQLCSSVDGAATVEEARGRLAHLAVCAPCRNADRVLRQIRQAGGMLVWNLPGIRRSALQYPARASRAAHELNRWFSELEAARPGVPLLTAVGIDASSGVSGVVPVVAETPPMMDSNGRFRLGLAPVPAADDLWLAVSLAGGGRRVYLGAVPAQEDGRFLLTVDCSFLGIAERRFDTGAVLLHLLSPSLAKAWATPRLLPNIERALAAFPDPVDFSDHLEICLFGHGESWDRDLAAEVAEAPDPVAAKAVADAAARRVGAYAEIWIAGNGTQDSNALALSSRLAQVAESTRRGSPKGEETVNRPTSRARKDRHPHDAH
jgi:hypothetical protein